MGISLIGDKGERKKLYRKYLNNKRLGGVALPSLLIRFLALIELSSLKGYRASVETIIFNTSW